MAHHVGGWLRILRRGGGKEVKKRPATMAAARAALSRWQGPSGRKRTLTSTSRLLLEGRRSGRGQARIPERTRLIRKASLSLSMVRRRERKERRKGWGGRLLDLAPAQFLLPFFKKRSINPEAGDSTTWLTPEWAAMNLKSSGKIMFAYMICL